MLVRGRVDTWEEFTGQRHGFFTRVVMRLEDMAIILAPGSNAAHGICLAERRFHVGNSCYIVIGGFLLGT
jgi:hypothetical protein